MIYSVQIEAQIIWDTEIEANSREEAEEKARGNFETSAWTNSMSIELINSITIAAPGARPEKE